MQQEADPSTLPEQPPDSIFTINRVANSCPAFLGRKASRVVRAARGSVCFVEHHTGRNKFLPRHLTT